MDLTLDDARGPWDVSKIIVRQLPVQSPEETRPTRGRTSQSHFHHLSADKKHQSPPEAGVETIEL